jgi:hypothetical protein
MLEDRLLLWRFKSGSRDAFRAIYEKYAGDLSVKDVAPENLPK